MKFKKAYLAPILGIAMSLFALFGIAAFGTETRPVAASDAQISIAAPLTDAAAASPTLHKYMIPRTLPGAEGFSSAQWKEISAASNEVVKQMQAEGKDIYWLESFVGKDNVTCLYMASGPELLYEHAKRGNFPINGVIEVARMIEPATAQ